ncbi:MAG: hypothetical protein AB7K24_29800, partial [Gemmataceae bacterium]
MVTPVAHLHRLLSAIFASTWDPGMTWSKLEKGRQCASQGVQAARGLLAQFPRWQKKGKHGSHIVAR